MEEVAFGEEGHKGLTPPPDMAPAAAPTDQPPVAAAEAAEAPAAVISSAVQLAKERARLAGLSALPALGARIKVWPSCVQQMPFACNTVVFWHLGDGT